jgi:hypothetical protein
MEGQGVFGALVATGSWLGDSLGLMGESEPPPAVAGGGRVGGDGDGTAVRAGDAPARRRAAGRGDKKDD